VKVPFKRAWADVRHTDAIPQKYVQDVERHDCTFCAATPSEPVSLLCKCAMRVLLPSPSSRATRSLRRPRDRFERSHARVPHLAPSPLELLDGSTVSDAGRLTTTVDGWPQPHWEPAHQSTNSYWSFRRVLRTALSIPPTAGAVVTATMTFRAHPSQSARSQEPDPCRVGQPRDPLTTGHRAVLSQGEVPLHDINHEQWHTRRSYEGHF
jgi:hypothetical protein